MSAVVTPTPPGARPSPTATDEPQDAIGKVLELMLEDGAVTPEQLAYARRIQAKLDNEKPLLDVLKATGTVSDAQVRSIIRAHPGVMRLGDVLVELGYIAPADLRAALAQQRSGEGQKLGEILIQNRTISEPVLTDVLADMLGLGKVEPALGEIDHSLYDPVRLRTCREHLLLPIARTDKSVKVAFADPLSTESRRVAEALFSCPVEATIARRTHILASLDGIERRRRAGRADDTTTTAISIVDDVLAEAIRADVSDVHIEPVNENLRVRFRIDGAMVDFKEYAGEVMMAVISRLKILARADIAERRRHQDGRIEFQDPASGNVVDIRASFYVTIHGEKVVLRLLNRKSELVSVNDVGMSPRMLERFIHDALEVPTGVVMITGPTGSGKTTTLYSAIDHMNTPDVSIITAEDPVEYVVPGVAQCSINPKIDLTFHETLRHIVRQDPDIIVLGEIRDQFSAETAIQAALTGHKVITTFHTEDSIGGLLRLLNLNIEAFLISSTVVSIVAQRLLRRVCASCAEPYQVSTMDLRRLSCRQEDIVGAKFRSGRGCADCRYTGYRGRVGVFELLVMNEMVKDAILNRKTSYEIRRISVETSGLVTLLEDGLIKAAQGATSLQEVMRHLPKVGAPRSLREIARLSGVTL
ncbi:MAG: ATPase, T2SS/T4P/T4SS family [Gammaproteobacteria bacterium]